MGHPQRPRSRNGAGLPAVTSEQIVDAALGLTAELGLDSWTLRQLAAKIEASPAVVYHHVGDRDSVVCRVLDQVVSQVVVPPETLPWREWFAQALDNHREVLRQYPGTAYRIAMHGPPVKAAATTIDLGVRLLQEAGFGAESVLAYNVLLTTACQYIAMEDAPIRAMRAHNIEHYLAYQRREDLPGLAAVGSFVAGLVSGPNEMAAFYDDIFRYAVQRCLDGMETRLTVLADMAR
jgi:AcrR family transcriptional regulator